MSSKDFDHLFTEAEQRLGREAQLSPLTSRLLSLLLMVILCLTALGITWLVTR